MSKAATGPVVKGEIDQADALVQRAREMELVDPKLEHEVQTDKRLVKILPCNECKRPLVVSTFYVAAWAKCSPCKGEEAGATTATVAVPQPGRTDPQKAVNLRDCLLNPQFGEPVVCPLCQEEMELKSVSHNPNYGPSRIVKYQGNIPIYENDPGETVMHQCNKCKCMVSMTTTPQSVYRRQNEPKHGSGEPVYEYLLGARAD